MDKFIIDGSEVYTARRSSVGRAPAWVIAAQVAIVASGCLLLALAASGLF